MLVVGGCHGLAVGGFVRAVGRLACVCGLARVGVAGGLAAITIAGGGLRVRRTVGFLLGAVGVGCGSLVGGRGFVGVSSGWQSLRAVAS